MKAIRTGAIFHTSGCILAHRGCAFQSAQQQSRARQEPCLIAFYCLDLHSTATSVQTVFHACTFIRMLVCLQCAMGNVVSNVAGVPGQHSCRLAGHQSGGCQPHDRHRRALEPSAQRSGTGAFVPFVISQCEPYRKNWTRLTVHVWKHGVEPGTHRQSALGIGCSELKSYTMNACRSYSSEQMPCKCYQSCFGRQGSPNSVCQT